MASVVIFFAAFCSYYIVMQGTGNWLTFELPTYFFYSTIIIIISSITMYLAQLSIRQGKFPMVKLQVGLTFILGLIFCWLQMKGWGRLFDQGIVFAGKNSNISGSILYVITFMHFLHICGGLIALMVVLFKSLKNRYSAQSHLGLTLGAIFWHFLDILWVVLFLFLYLNR